LRQQHIGVFQVASLSAGQIKTEGIAQSIDRGVNLGAQSALAASDGLIRAPFSALPRCVDGPV